MDTTHSSARHSAHSFRRQRGHAVASRYRPLFVLILFAFLAAGAKQFGYTSHLMLSGWMHDFMGFFFVMFAMFKFFDPRGFAEGFQKYDLLAGIVRPYAYLYPFLELGLGLAYLARWRLPLVYLITVGLMVFGAIGVMRALAKGLDVNCACMGTVLKVPLSTVTLTEDIGMAAMAGSMWALSAGWL